MEGSVKINWKKKLPSIPSNYVSLLQLQERWKKEKEQKQDEKEGPQQAQEEKETKAKERVPDEVAGRERRKNGHFRRYDGENWKRVAEAKSREEEIAKDFTVNESEDVEKEKKGEELKSEKKKKKKKWQKNKKKNKEEKARADNEGEELGGPAVNAPLPASMENNKGDEEVIKDEVHAPKLASVEEENVEGRRESQPRIITRTDGRTAASGRRFGAPSMKVEIRTGDYCRYSRQNGYFNHRGGNTELNRRYYGRRREQNQRNEGMVWVKKGEVSDGNASGNQARVDHPRN